MTTVLDGRVALVTGGSRGIGAGVATQLAEDGADVVLTFQHRDNEATAAVELTVAEFGRLDAPSAATWWSARCSPASRSTR